MADTVASTPWRGQTAEIVKVLNYTRGFYVGLVIYIYIFFLKPFIFRDST